MPKKESGMWRNKNAPMSKNYRAGGFSGNWEKIGPARPLSPKETIVDTGRRASGPRRKAGPGGYAGGGATEVGKKVQSYKEYVKKTFGGGKT